MKKHWAASVLFIAVLAVAQKVPPHQDQWLIKPVDGRTYQNYLEFFRYDSKLPFDVKVLGTEQRDAGFTKEHLSFVSTPGVKVSANLYRPTSAVPGKLPTLIVLHGGSGPGKDAQYMEVLATILTRAGYQVFAPDLQYFGERASPDMLATYTDIEKRDKLYNQPSTYLAWVTQTVKDASRSIDLLVEQRSADPQRIALIGFSRGGILGAIVGGAERRFRAVVLLHGGHFNAQENGHLPAACPANYVGHISPRPLLMINGTRDRDLIKESSSEPLYRVAKMPKQILWADTGHQFPTDEHRAYMVQWLHETLK